MRTKKTPNIWGMINSCNTSGILQLELCRGASGRGKEEGCEGCCRGDFGIQLFFVRSSMCICLALEDLRVLESAVSLLAERRRALCPVGWADVGRSAPPLGSDHRHSHVPGEGASPTLPQKEMVLNDPNVVPPVPFRGEELSWPRSGRGRDKAPPGQGRKSQFHSC